MRRYHTEDYQAVYPKDNGMFVEYKAVENLIKGMEKLKHYLDNRPVWDSVDVSKLEEIFKEKLK